MKGEGCLLPVRPMDVETELSEKRVERNVMEAELDDDALSNSERYHTLESRIAELRSQLDGY